MEAFMKKTVLVIVNSSLRTSVDAALRQYVFDLEHIEKYSVVVHETSGGTAYDMKDYIKKQYHRLFHSKRLAGCVFIGDLPVPWYGNPTDRYPIDLFYMDLNGDWPDANQDGIIDQCPSQPDPVIWVGRLTAGPLSGNEAALLNSYFAKNHRYRSGMLDVPERAMAYIDDEWIAKGDYGMTSAYADVQVINDVMATNANDYKLKLAGMHEFFQCAVHSSATAHTFKQNYALNGSVVAADIHAINPQQIFYCVDACQSARYTVTDYIGGWYIFSQGLGLVFMGETKNANSMDGPSEFYSSFGDGHCFGDAFIRWLGPRSTYHMDRTILGDPTLKRRSHYAAIRPSRPMPPSNVHIR
jgi:hypothetical protein